MKVISTIAVILIGLGILFFVAMKGVSVDVVPTLSEYVASTSKNYTTISEEIIMLSESTASSTRVNGFFGDNTATSTPIISAEKSPLLAVHAPKGIIRMTVAKTPSTRERGLSGRPTLEVDEGMLFIFPKAGTYSFWMKDMNFPIDIIWMDPDKKVIGISENVSPDSYPKSFSPPSEIQFVIEVLAGSAQKFGLKVGSTVIF